MTMNNLGLLKEFEQQFSTVTAEITTKIYKLLNGERVSDKIADATLQELEDLLKDANELLERMELEVRDAPQDQREKLGNRVISYEVELNRLKDDYVKAVKSSKMLNEGLLRQELFAGKDTDEFPSFSGGDEQKQHLLDNTEVLERTSTRLAHSYKSALEAEQVGAQILNDLQYQRNTLEHARTRLHNTDEDLNQSSRVLNFMMKRFMQNKFILTFVISMVGFIIFLIIYLKFLR